MASIGQRPNGRWEARWRDATQRSWKRVFDTREEADALLMSVSVGQPKGRRGGSKRRTRSQVIDLIAQNFEVSADGCWMWTGTLTNAGYARLNWRPLGTNIPGAHRVVLAAIGQPVPVELVVDHLCRNRACVNPDHLEAVGQRENVMRSPVAPAALNAAKTHCPQGHPYTPDNTYVYTFKTRKTTTRVCRTCQRTYSRARYLKQKEMSA